MDRRDFLITTGGALAATTAAAHAASAQPNTGGLPQRAEQTGALKLAMPWPDAPHGPAEAAHNLAQRITTMTDGRVRLAATGGCASSDEADFFFAPAHHFAALHPAFAYFAGLPGPSGLSPTALAQWMAVGGGQMLWDDLAAQHGWKPLLAGHLGDAPPLWSSSRIEDLRSLSGQRVAAAGLGADVARAIGAEPVAVPPGEIGKALQTGALRAAEAGGLVASLASGVARAATFATGSGINANGTALALHIRLPLWERLQEADRLILAAAAADAYHTSLAEASSHAPIARKTLEATFGTTFAPWPTDVAEAIERVAEATIAHVAGFDAVAERIDHSYFAFRGLATGGPISYQRRPRALA